MSIKKVSPLIGIHLYFLLVLLVDTKHLFDDVLLLADFAHEFNHFKSLKDVRVVIYIKII